MSLTAQFPLGSDFEGDTSDFCSKRPEPNDHSIHGVLEIKYLAVGIYLYLL
jgi:hypothetical protein